MPVTSVKSSWSSGSLVFHEKSSYAPSTTYDILTLGTTAVKIGNTANDVDFQYYGTGSISAIIDCGAATFTLVGIALASNGALTITNATATSSTTTGALIVTGGIATAADITCGDDLFMSNGGVINFNAGNLTLTHSAGTLTNSGILVNTGAVSVDDTTESTSTTTGSIHTDGGLGVAKDIYAGDDVFLTSGAVLNFNAGNVTLTHAANALTFATSRATAAMDDGYGMFEVDATVTGTGTGHAAASSSWLNIPSGTAAAGSYQCARNDGIYEAVGATITNAKIIFGARMQKILGDTDALSFPWSINTSNAGITALIDCSGTTTGDLSVVTNAGGDTGTLVPFCRDVNATKYIKLYDLA